MHIHWPLLKGNTFGKIKHEASASNRRKRGEGVLFTHDYDHPRLPIPTITITHGCQHPRLRSPTVANTHDYDHP
ncbi:hypothetical protein POVWA1_039450 [Plasmodium ovale wallikeri]|uniref:Uncharacterized protein n=1 Tax=Plasmodium ovale wallikeri TaxID=864142 RepID=A0A1A8Z5Q0_PLAOA|nr:hypothetical protein POVWA1_039450 [Plasmodium ovale wallikeri]